LKKLLIPAITLNMTNRFQYLKPCFLYMGLLSLFLSLSFYYQIVPTNTIIWSPSCQSNNEVDVQRERYLNLLIMTLTGSVYGTRAMRPGTGSVNDLKTQAFSEEVRNIGNDWPEIGYTMIGNDALKSLKVMIQTVIREKIPGDFLEAGVWRGGASILAKGVLRSYGADKIRKVWVCDSFKGLPKNRTPHDNAVWERMHALRVSKTAVQQHFRKFDLLDENVKFVEGYFVNSLPQIRANVTELAVLRLDGDMYESTMDILFNLYEKVTIGGFVIIDDYGIKVCREAITKFRGMHNITEELLPIWNASSRYYWVKKRHQSLQHDWYKKLIPTS